MENRAPEYCKTKYLIFTPFHIDEYYKMDCLAPPSFSGRFVELKKTRFFGRFVFWPFVSVCRAVCCCLIIVIRAVTITGISTRPIARFCLFKNFRMV